MAEESEQEKREKNYKINEYMVKATDMTDAMRDQSVRIISSNVRYYKEPQLIAKGVKEDFDKKFKYNWHCVVGADFGSTVTHEGSHFLFMFVDTLAVLVFKTRE
ncbi:unnamed protein product [Lymnaea stagnalis]|uniref:Dynein light chain n=1 Tax=Lymnaea stagnalis TaxID=6523 RepID=A0AAV2HKP4_LYMST